MLVGWNFKHVRFKIVMNNQQLGPLLSSVQPLYWTQHWKYLISSFIFLILSDPGSVPHNNVTKVSQPNFPFSELSPIFRLMISSVSRSNIKQSRSQQHTGCLISDGDKKNPLFTGLISPVRQNLSWNLPYSLVIEAIGLNLFDPSVIYQLKLLLQDCNFRFWWPTYPVL